MLDRLELGIQPGGIKYLCQEPEGIPALDQRMAFCEMLRKTKGGDASCAASKDHSCEAGAYVLGQAEAEGPFVSGEFGAGLGVFRDQRAAARLCQYIPRVAPRVANYAALPPLDRLPLRSRRLGPAGRHAPDRDSAAGHELRVRPTVVKQVFSGDRVRLASDPSLRDRRDQLLSHQVRVRNARPKPLPRRSALLLGPLRPFASHAGDPA